MSGQRWACPSFGLRGPQLVLPGHPATVFNLPVNLHSACLYFSDS